MNVHEKNVHLQSKVVELQKKAKDFMFTNLKNNQKHEQEKKNLNVEIDQKNEEIQFKEKKIKSLMEFIDAELQKYEK